ncbi:MAG: UDP-N-acetylmuramoyl-L-alanine--D-glutamate ligase [Gemmatimonadaceae bacterium]|nr:UDP-N-acetylmuramoyl-L-alanine--D-glutamate ligase [Gemmatimonadaceae bacterium]
MIPAYDWSRGEVAVVGLGRSGSSATLLLRRLGAQVYASDAGTAPAVAVSRESLLAVGASVDVGRHDLPRIARASLVIASPGVPPTAPPLVAARSAGVPIISEVELALAAMPGLRYVAVTGTNGKSTVTALVAHLLRSVGVSVEAAGNIGTPLSEVALRAAPPAWVALEVSSFQLHDTPSINPTVGVLTNLSPDHLDRYDSVEAYYADKALLFRHAHADSNWVVNADDPAAVAMARGIEGKHFRFSAFGRLCDAFLGGKGKHQLIVDDEILMTRDQLPLLGSHNVANALAAVMAVMATDPAHESFDDRARMVAALESFRALPHRLEPVADREGVLWINDSKATNVASALVAIESMQRPTILLLGGRHKGEAYTSLLDAIARHCRMVLAFGEAAPIIEGDLAGRAAVQRVDGSFANVMARAHELARSGDAVLLAPACSSFDMFRNYEERGRAFAAAARGEG